MIDSHQHFWQLSRDDYEWLTPVFSEIYRDFQPTDLLPELNANNVEKTIVIQAAASIDETEYLLQLAEKTSFIAGVVGWVDFESNSAVDDLMRLSANPYFKGVRPMLQDIEDIDWILNPKFAPIFRALITNNLVFDALIKPAHLANIFAVMKQYPQLKFVIDHAAKPEIKTGEISAWAHGIHKVSRLPNAYCKLSGLMTEAGTRKSKTALQAYVDVLLEAFSSDRLLWGSDWPVLHMANISYSDWLTMSESLLYSLSDAQKLAVFRQNAINFYGIDWELNE